MLFGDKTTSMFDVWSIQHLLFAVSLTSFSKKIIGSKSTTTRILTLSILLAYSWEASEWYMETGLGNQNIQFWFQGHEYWANRFITDPILLVLGGYALATRVPGICGRHVWRTRYGLRSIPQSFLTACTCKRCVRGQTGEHGPL